MINALLKKKLLKMNKLIDKLQAAWNSLLYKLMFKNYK